MSLLVGFGTLALALIGAVRVTRLAVRGTIRAGRRVRVWGRSALARDRGRKRDIDPQALAFALLAELARLVAEQRAAARASSAGRGSAGRGPVIDVDVSHPRSRKGVS